MRYLVFNLLVVGALAFLLFDGDPPTSVRGAVDKVAVEADRLIAKGKSLVESAKTERPAPPEPVSETAPPAATPSKAIDRPASGLDPAVARRRAEVLGEAPDDGATVAATSDFMAPGVRRSELNKLAEDMELMFVEKVGR